MLSSNLSSKHVYFISTRHVFVFKDGQVETCHELPFQHSTNHKNLENKDKNHSTTGSTLAACISPTERHLCWANDLKQVYCLELAPDGVKPFIDLYLPKRVSCLCFDRDESFILIGDKSGDVYKIPKKSALTGSSDEKLGDEDDEDDQRVIYGHFSLLTSLVVSPCGTLLASCDRDEKIRVSHYPATCDIQRFLLGHKKFVTDLKFLDSRVIVSCGGDCQIIVWDALSGSIKHKYTLDGLVPVQMTILHESLCLLSLFNSASFVVIDLAEPASQPRLLHLPDTASSVVQYACYDKNKLIILTAKEDQGRTDYCFYTATFNKDGSWNELTRRTELGEALKDHNLPVPHPRLEFLQSLIKSDVDISGRETYERNKLEHHKAVLGRRQRHNQQRTKKKRGLTTTQNDGQPSEEEEENDDQEQN